MVQAWSMGTATKMVKSKSTSNLAPGPGAYNGNFREVKKKSPGWKMGTQSRPGLHHDGHTPGPGAYAHDDKKYGPKYVMGIKTQVDFSYLKATPGPGNYLSTTALLGVQGKGYSFGGKKEFSQLGRNFPGPGTYEIRSAISMREKGKSFGRDSKTRGDSTDRYLKSVPGPGSYNNTAEMLKSAAPRFGFGSEKKGNLPNSRQATPGPGTYEQKVHGKTAPRGLLVPRRPDSAPAYGRGTPGPGQYNDTLTTKKSAPKFGMGTSKARADPSKDLLRSPAPNAYSPSRNQTLIKSPSYVMGTGKRRPLSSRNPNPGPGAYSYTDRVSTPAWGMRGKCKNRDSNDTPGPGQYDPLSQTIKEKAPAIRIGTEEKIANDKTTKRIVPGPGQYDNPKVKIIKASPSYGFGTGSRDKSNKGSNPGPGHYHIPCKVADVPRYLNTKQEEAFRFI